MAATGLKSDSSMTDPWVMSSRSEKNNSSSRSIPGKNLDLNKETINEKNKSLSTEKHPSPSPSNTEINPESVERSQKKSEVTIQQAKSADLKEGEPTLNNEVDLNGNLDRIDDELDENDPELIITEEEKRAFDAMLSQKREDLANRKISFEKWSDSITRRRMFALSRIRKLGICQKERIKFYKQMGQFVKDAGDALETAAEVVNNSNNNIINATTSPSSPASDECSQSENKSPKGEEATSHQSDSQREGTGFVVKTESSDNAAKSESSDTYGKGGLSVTKTENPNTEQLPVIHPVPS